MKKKIYFIAILIAAVLFAACSTEKAKTTTPDVGLTGETAVISLQSADDSNVNVIFAPTDTKNLPRIMDIYINYDPKVLTFKGHKKGEALADAEKEIYVNSEKIPGVIRITSLSAANVNRVAGGNVVTLEFDKIDDGETVIELDRTKQVFAPADANNQVTFGKALTL